MLISMNIKNYTSLTQKLSFTRVERNPDNKGHQVSLGEKHESTVMLQYMYECTCISRAQRKNVAFDI